MIAAAGKLVVGCAQTHSALDPAENLARCIQLTNAAAGLGVQLLVFPESVSSRSDDPAVPPKSERLHEGFVRGLADHLADSEMVVIAGVIESTGDGRPYNTLVAIRRGEIVGIYRKVHLYDAAGMKESDSIAPGDGPVVTFDVNGFRVGMMTCYDIRFPELSRLLAERGADVVVVATSWVRGALKVDHWRTLCASRAIENTMYIAAAAQTGGVRIGRSTVVAPDGVAEVTLGTEVDLAVTRISRRRIEEVRAEFPVLAQRRFSIDATLLPHTSSVRPGAPDA